jgi:triacylglycerol lipase
MRPWLGVRLRRSRWLVPALLLVVGAAAAGATGAQAVRRGPPGAPPGQEARVPVVLVPGWSDDAHQLEVLRGRFLAAGWPDGSVVALTFDDPVGSNRTNAERLRLAVEDLRSRTGAERVDVVAHSMGGLATRYYLKSADGGRVRRVVFLATPHRGTYAAYVAWGEGGREMSPGSEFLRGLNEPFRALPPGVEGITIRTPVDLHILPPESALLPPLPDVEVCCPTHAGLLDDPETFRVIESFLSRAP